ncbi:MAG: hypothetical protein RI575_18415 [Balneolaceae bacterium]|nr:hypothetical protein [Balneolaceae bacterium]MDR9410822.1 hypothetical protein [Balneolaceae bacterium]
MGRNQKSTGKYPKSLGPDGSGQAVMGPEGIPMFRAWFARTGTLCELLTG